MIKQESGLLRACRHLARQVLSGVGAQSADVVETLAGKFLAIAEDHQDFVRQERETDDVIEHAVLYLADVHAVPPHGTDTAWFREALNVLMELAVPNSALNEDAAQLMPSLQEGINQALASVPIGRNELRLEDEDVVLLKRLEEAGCEYGCVSDLLDLVERLFHGDLVQTDDRRFWKLAALAAPMTRRARGEPS